MSNHVESSTGRYFRLTHVGTVAAMHLLNTLSSVARAASTLPRTLATKRHAAKRPRCKSRGLSMLEIVSCDRSD